MNLESKAQEREIDGVQYRVWPIPFGVGRPALVRLIGILAPVMSSLFRAKSKAELGAGLFDSLPSSLSDADLAYFAKLFGDAAQYKNDKGDWAPLVEKVHGDHFAGRYLAFFQWIAFACEVNFKSFFSGMKNVEALDGFLQTMKSK